MIDHTVHCLTTGNVSVVKNARDAGHAACLMAQHIEERDGYAYDSSKGHRLIVIETEVDPWRIVARTEVAVAWQAGNAVHEFSVVSVELHTPTDPPTT